jgi:hypothetical protein
MVLDLYLPRLATRKPQPLADRKRLPLVIFIHGGGWVRGSHCGYRPAHHLDQSSEIQCVVSLYGAISWTASAWTNSRKGSHLMNETLPDFQIANGSHLPPILFLNEWDRRKNRRWGADTMEIIQKLGKADRAELTLINAPHGFIYFSPHQKLALDYLEQFFGKQLGPINE